MLVYLSTAPGSAQWGTDIYDAERHHAGRAPAGFDQGLIFVPASDTWHGFEPRRIDGVRRSIIVNYVVPEWRARHELAVPEQPVLAALSRPAKHPQRLAGPRAFRPQNLKSASEGKRVAGR